MIPGSLAQTGGPALVIAAVDAPEKASRASVKRGDGEIKKGGTTVGLQWLVYNRWFTIVGLRWLIRV